MELSFASPEWALVGVAVALPLAALLVVERRASRVRALLRLRRPEARASAAPVVAILLVAGLVSAAVGQPVLIRHEKQLVRRDTELYVIMDNSRSMLAAADADGPTRWERAQRIGLELRRAFPDLPIGLASITDRLMVHLFPTVDAGTFAATLERAMGVDRPPPNVASRRASRLAVAADVGVWNFFSDTARDRLAVVLTDGEGQESDPRGIRSALADAVPVRFLFVHVWQDGERVFGPQGAEPGYTSDPGSGVLLERVARAVRGRSFAEAAVPHVEAAVRRGLPAAEQVDLGTRSVPRPLAPYAAAAAFLPLAFLVRRRNRA